MKKTLLVLLLVGAFLAACAPATPATPTPDVNATVNAMLATSVAATLTAQPTSTPQPTNTPLPTDTPAPSSTPEPIITDTPVVSETPIASPTSTADAAGTPIPFVGCFAPAGTGNIRLGVFRFENNTKETVEVYLHGVSLNGNKEVNCSYTVTKSFNTEIIFGNYDYTVQIGSKKTVDGTFFIVNDDKTTMRIYDKKVVVVGP